MMMLMVAHQGFAKTTTPWELVPHCPSLHSNAWHGESALDMLTSRIVWSLNGALLSASVSCEMKREIYQPLATYNILTCWGRLLIANTSVLDALPTNLSLILLHQSFTYMHF